MNLLKYLMSFSHPLTFSTFFIYMLGIIFLLKEVISAADWLLNYLGITSRRILKREQESKRISDISCRLDIQAENIDKLCDANRVILSDRINQKYKVYLNKGYIPEDEYEEFVSLHNVYNEIGGNHTGDEKFSKCIKQLPIKPDN
ncbi:hypothetical protein [Dorea sp. D27]|uniref:hypothetical protein n=1 Tax=Dorea sp. D27 TaxID=658665 RepID=UPI000673AEFC|nr:hypothetical protein [Dorea sp. D27]KMZ55260.1 hypothetical protein HMPREF0980_00608 [Dorea sp. D27]